MSLGSACEVAQPVHAADRLQLVGFDVRPRWIHEAVFNVNSDGAPQNDPGAADLDRHVVAALQGGMFSAGRGGLTSCDDAVVNLAPVEMYG